MDTLKEVVVALAKKAEQASAPHEAMQLAQAALNVAHALATLNAAK